MIPVVSRRGPIVLAHRGGGAEAPENTMAAFEHARSLGPTPTSPPTAGSSSPMTTPWTAASTGPG